MPYDPPNKEGPGGPVIVYGGLSSLFGGMALPSVFLAKTDQDILQVLTVEFSIVASNYVLNKLSDHYWHWKEPGHNPKGKITKESAKAQLVIGGIGLAIGIINACTHGRPLIP